MKTMNMKTMNNNIDNNNVMTMIIHKTMNTNTTKQTYDNITHTYT